MEFVIRISQFLLSLSLLIVLHELGHFIPAKLFGAKVEKFYLFFDLKFSLFKKKIGDTEYGIGWLPLGGYVKIAGMMDESMDKEQMAQPPKAWEFRSKPAWQRLIIMLGGVTVNFILAYVIYVFLAFGYGDIDINTNSIQDGYTVTNPILTNLGLKTGDNVVSINGEKVTMYSDIKKKLIEAEKLTILSNNEIKEITLPEDFLGQLSTGDSRSFFGLRTPFVINNVIDTLANKGKDLRTGDIIVSVNDVPLKYFDQLADRVEPFSGGEISVTILRDEKTIAMQLNVDTNGKLGIQSGVTLNDVEKLGYYDIIRKEYGLGESIVVGYDKFTETVASYGVQLKKIFTPSTGAYKGVGGFKAIYSIFPADWSWQAFWSLTAFLSIMLGVLNLLPIPVLDGGHVMFLLYEIVSGRAPNEKFLERAQLVGFILLIAMVLSANINDWI